MTEGIVVVMMTAPGEEEAAEIARKVVTEGLAACCNIVGGVRSIYTWKGEVADEREALCILKTKKSLFEELKARIVELHGYDVPEVVAVDVVSGHADYLEWVEEVTR
ncbi:MAG: divalent-cation tolerance protein CutA [Thermodesulfobacteriota bacterium]